MIKFAMREPNFAVLGAQQSSHSHCQRLGRKASPASSYQQYLEGDFAMLFPEPSHIMYSPIPDDLGLSSESFSPYHQPRSCHKDYDRTMGCYEFTSMAPALDGILSGAGGCSPPSIFPKDDTRLPSSNLSSVSASSSTLGSPLSNHDALGPHEWTLQGLGVSPGIVEHHDYYTGGHDYQFHALDSLSSFEGIGTSGVNKPPGFVGESPHVSPRHPAVSSHEPRHTPRSSGLSNPLALDTPFAAAQNPLSGSPGTTSASSAASSMGFAAPVTSSLSSDPSPPLSAWSIPSGVDAPRPDARIPARFHFPHFFAQSSGNYIAPLDTSYPSLIHPPEVCGVSMQPQYEYPLPNSTFPGSPALTASPRRTASMSPPMPNSAFAPQYPAYQVRSPRGPQPLYSGEAFSSEVTPCSGDESSQQKQRCPHPECGRILKDLKAHMLTHQNERPEKCPIASCDYHTKGFARKYDKNRHTLTHYKGTMVCSFCPGPGSASEKSFNRADVFKRHLTAVHGVEQSPPNARRRTTGGVSGSGQRQTSSAANDATGRCSTCSQTFPNAQDFYEHLDDCVLRIVQQEEPSESINASNLAQVENDRNVHSTLEKNNLPTTSLGSMNPADDEDEDMEEDDHPAGVDFQSAPRGSKNSTSHPKLFRGNPANGVQKSRGMTHSPVGLPSVGKPRGRKSRRDYPSSWGFDQGQMTMRKRVLAVFDGTRRLAKDDMMLSTEHEIRLKLANDNAYVTDLDVQTLKHAEAFLSATEEEKGGWISGEPTEEDLQQMMTYIPEP